MPYFDGKYYADCKTIKDMFKPLEEMPTHSWWFSFTTKYQPMIPYRWIVWYWKTKGWIKKTMNGGEASNVKLL